MLNFASMIDDAIKSGSKLPIMEHFHTIQGEGFHSGKSAYFVRISGCDVGCHWCDVKESWDTVNSTPMDIDNIVRLVVQSNSRFCVITGGEPCMYDLSILCKALKSNNIEVAIETSGCYELKGELDWYCFSPKKFKKPNQESYVKANELKVIISHPSDFKWAEEHAELVNSKCLLYLQPEWSKQERFLPLIIEYVKNHPKWKISLQTHKYLNIP
jgi:organic radical activating enzyme